MLDLTMLQGAGRTAVFAVALMAAACSPRGRAPAASTSSLAVRSAVIEPSAPTLSCRGDAFCREDVVTTPDAEATDELISSCALRGGKASWTACTRERVVATCAVENGEVGPTLVLTYAQGREREAAAVEKMSDLCEQVEGTFARTSR